MSNKEVENLRRCSHGSLHTWSALEVVVGDDYSRWLSEVTIKACLWNESTIVIRSGRQSWSSKVMAGARWSYWKYWREGKRKIWRWCFSSWVILHLHKLVSQTLSYNIVETYQRWQLSLHEKNQAKVVNMMERGRGSAERYIDLFLYNLNWEKIWQVQYVYYINYIKQNLTERHTE